MRRVLLALLSTMALAGVMVTLPALPASGALIEAFDASVSVTDLVGEISPAGSYGLYEVAAEIEGLTEADGTITTSVTGGAIDAERSDLAACENQSAGTTCDVTIAPGEPTTIRLAVLSDAGATEVVVSSALVLDDDDTLVAVDVDETNNSDAATTPVTATGQSSAFVPEGDSLAFQANGQTHVLTVTLAEGDGGGAIVRMSDPGTMDCAGQPCNGVHIEFEQGGDGQAFEAETEIDSTGDHDPCRGLGEGSTCTDVYWRDPTGTKGPTVMTKLSACGFEADGEPCLQQKYKVDGNIHYVTEMDTDDPDLGLPGIPPIDV